MVSFQIPSPHSPQRCVLLKNAVAAAVVVVVVDLNLIGCFGNRDGIFVFLWAPYLWNGNLYFLYKIVYYLEVRSWF